MIINIETITPLKAAVYLENNKSNRKVNASQLDMLCRTIEDGKWRLTHQGIAFYEGGELADGQHRLEAIIKTGTSLKFPVFYGVERERDTVLAIDSGRSRTVVDSGRISGVNLNFATIAVIKGIHFGYAKGFSKKLTHSEVCDLMSKYSKEAGIHKLFFSKSVPSITIAPVKAACIQAYIAVGESQCASSFIDTLITGEYSDKIFTNAVRLRTKLFSQNYNGGMHRLPAYNMTYNAIIRTCKGESIKYLNPETPST